MRYRRVQGPVERTRVSASLVAPVEDTGKPARRLLGASRDNQLAATNERKLAGGEQGLRDQRAAVKSTRGGA